MKSLKRIDAAIDAVTAMINETDASGSELAHPEMRRSFDVLYTLLWVRGRLGQKTPEQAVREYINTFNFLRGSR